MHGERLGDVDAIVKHYGAGEAHMPGNLAVVGAADVNKAPPFEPHELAVLLHRQPLLSERHARISVDAHEYEITVAHPGAGFAFGAGVVVGADEQFAESVMGHEGDFQMQYRAVGDFDVEFAHEAVDLEVVPAFAFQELQRAAVGVR